MPEIYVEFNGLKEAGSNCGNVSSKVNNIRSEFQNTVRALDWDVKYSSDINNTANSIARKLENYSQVLKKYQSFIDEAHNRYSELNDGNFGDFSIATDNSTSESISLKRLWAIIGPYLKLLVPNTIINRGIIIPALHKFITTITPLSILNTGFLLNTINILNSSDINYDSDYLGYDFDKQNTKVTAYVGKSSSSIKNGSAEAEVNAYVGKGEAEFKSEFSFMKKKRSYEEKRNNEIEDKEKFNVINGEISAGVSANIVSADLKADAGDDIFGAEIKADGGLGNASAKGDVKASLGEDGVNLYASGKAMVSAAEGKASGTIDIFGVEITGNIGGYAGAAGVEGEVGIKDSKFVLKGGLAAILGFSAGVEIGFNDTGWDNFIDSISYWV